MSDETNRLEMYGEVETVPGMEPDSENSMVVRILGYDVGVSDGWFHFQGGWCVMAPNFTPNTRFGARYPAANLICQETTLEPSRVFGLVIDLYAGRIALTRHAAKGSKSGFIEVLWEGALHGGQ